MVDTCYVSYDIDCKNYNKNLIKTKTYVKNGVEYMIMNYDKEILCFDNSTNSIYRSVIVANPQNTILAFSPSKSMDLDLFQQKYPDTNNESKSSIYVNEIIEGTMVNLFYDKRIQLWEISTRSAVGGSYFYYRNKPEHTKTFYKMFMEIMAAGENQELNDLPFLTYLPKSCSYSFVLQHPENHIILSIQRPRLFLVAVYDIRDNHVVAIPSVVYENWDIFMGVHGIIEFPQSYEFTFSYSELKEKYASTQTEYTYLGIMLTCLSSGDRCVMRNPNYEKLKVIRGNNPNIQYQYLALRRIQKVKDFLHYFPQYKKLFYQFYNELNEFIENVHTSYLRYYVKKDRTIPILDKYLPHICNIHREIYLHSLHSGVTIVIRKRSVRDYFDSMTPMEILYHLNFDKRRQFQG
jgi:hypothetical protein